MFKVLNIAWSILTGKVSKETKRTGKEKQSFKTTKPRDVIIKTTGILTELDELQLLVDEARIANDEGDEVKFGEIMEKFKAKAKIHAPEFLKLF